MAMTQPSQPYSTPFYEGETFEHGIRLKLKAFVLDLPPLFANSAYVLNEVNPYLPEIQQVPVRIRNEEELMEDFLRSWSQYSPWRNQILSDIMSGIIPQIDPEFSRTWRLELCEQIYMAMARAERINHRRGIRFIIDFDVHTGLVSIDRRTRQRRPRQESWEPLPELSSQQRQQEVDLWTLSSPLQSLEALAVYYGQALSLPLQQQQLPGIDSLGAIPASRAAIENLTRVRYDDDDVRVRGRECSICFDEFETKADPDLACMPCSHTFHYLCLVQWLELSRACPLCRHPLIE